MMKLGNKIKIPACLFILLSFSLSLSKDTNFAQKAMYPPPLSFDSIIDYRLYEALLKGINTRVIWAGNNQNKYIALTFDDGPNPKYTPKVLKILEQEQVRATFFLIGHHAEQQPELVKQIHLAGHEIGNHTYSHVMLTKVPSIKIKQELERTRDIVQKLTGTNTVLFRPPWGVFNGRSLAELALRKFDVVLWSVDSRDWSRPGIAAIKKNILNSVRNGSIILCHDDHDQIVTALPEIIHELKSHGYKFVTVSEMMSSSL
ncbi:MAG: polysaccharide deacetylase family protein [bacterium]|nr:polysaccharide deacetylase family protein [bacterium]